MTDAMLNRQTPPLPVELPLPARAWQRVLPPGSTVVAGVSGGADSLHMALLLAAWALAHAGRVIVVHVNHGHRGPDDALDGGHVRAFAERFGVEFVARRLEGFTKGQPSLEDRMRRARLAVLHEEAARAEAAALALGHHADDVAESLLLMALRGAGAAGLGSLREARWLDREHRWLIRPNWSLRKRDLEQTLRDVGIAWRIDPTNAEPSMRRNRLRAEVTPLLEAMEPAAVELLARSAMLCAEVHDEADAVAHERLVAAERARGRGFVVVEIDPLRALSSGACKQVLRAAWMSLAGGDDEATPAPAGAWLEALDQRLHTRDQHDATFDPMGGVVAHATNNLLLLRSTDADPVAAWADCLARRGVALALDGEPDGFSVGEATGGLAPGDYHRLVPGRGVWTLRVQPVESVSRAWDGEAYRTAAVASFDVEGLAGELIVRRVLPGDRLTLKGGGTKPADEALREAGVPSMVRDRVLGLADARGLLWLPGVRRGAEARLSPATRRVLTLEWRHAPGAFA